MAEVEDGLVPIRGGKIDMTVNGKTFRLRLPTFGELRDLLIDAERVDEEGAKRSVIDTIRENIEWWLSAIKMLSDEDPPLLESCPPWVGGQEVITKATRHWMKDPTPVPGN